MPSSRRRASRHSRNPSPPREPHHAHRHRRDSPPLPPPPPPPRRDSAAAASAEPPLTATLSRWVAASATLQETIAERLSTQQIPASPYLAGKVKPPTFDGSRAWQVFEAQFDTAATANNWSETEKGQRLLTALKGAAANVIQSLPRAEFTNYESVRRRLASHYGAEQRGLLAHTKFTSRRQKEGESLTDFASDIEQLARLAFPTWPEEVLQVRAQEGFLAGIADPELRRTVRLTVRQAATMEDTLATAVHIESVNQVEPPTKRARVAQASVAACNNAAVASASRARSRSRSASPLPARRVTSQSQPAPAKDVMEAIEALRKALLGQVEPAEHSSRARSPKRKVPADAQCFYCKGYGHFRNQCPKLHRDDRARDRRYQSGDRTRRSGHDDRRHGQRRADDDGLKKPTGNGQ